MQTILENQKSSVGSPYVFYNLAYEEVERTTDSVTLKFREDANLQYSSSTLGGSYWITSYVNIEGTEYAIEIKPSGQSWSGTTKHRVERTITIPMPASQTLITNVKFRCASRNSDSGYLSSVDCSNISISLAHNPPMITNYTITETNQDLIDVGIGDEVFVANLSKKNINIVYSLFDNATLQRASVYNTTNQNYLSPTLPVLMDSTQYPLYTTEDGVPIYVRITDSLDSATYFSNNGVVDGRINPDFYNFIPYTKISLTNSSTIAKRIGQISGRVGLTINGNFYNGIVGNIDQTSYKPTIKYKFWKYGDTEPTTYDYTIPSSEITINNDTFNVDNYDIGSTIETDTNFFNPEYSYRIKIYIEDNFTNIESNELQIQVGEAVWTEYPNRVDFSRLTIQGDEVFHSIITANPTSNVTLTTQNATKIPLETGNIIGRKLTISNGGIKVGSGVAKVLVSGTILFSTGGTTSSRKGLQIYLNDTPITYNNTIGSETYIGVSCTPIIIDVQKNDVIYLYGLNQGGTGSIVQASNTYLTVEAV